VDKKEILDFLNANRSFFLATVEGDRPHVRGMMLYRADEDGIIFQSGKMKDLYREILVNPRVELCFNNFKEGIQIRVSGKAEILDDKDLEHEIISRRDFLRRWVEEDGYAVAVFRIRKGKAALWTRAVNLEPKEYIEL